MKVGGVCNLEAAVGGCRSARVHAAADCCTFPVAVPTQMVVADGLMLLHGAPLTR